MQQSQQPKFSFPQGLPKAFQGQTQTKQADHIVVFVNLVSSWEDKKFKLTPGSSQSSQMTTLDSRVSLAENKAQLLTKMVEGKIGKSMKNIL